MVEIFSLEISILDIWLWKVVPSKLFSKLWNGQISTIINTSSKLVDICSRSSRIRKVLDSEVAIYLFQIFKCFCCWHASLLPKRWEGSKTHHTLLMTLYGGLCIRAHCKFEFQTRHSNVDTYFQILATTNPFLEGYAIWPKDVDTVTFLLKVNCNSDFGTRLCNLLGKDWLYLKSWNYVFKYLFLCHDYQFNCFENVFHHKY